MTERQNDRNMVKTEEKCWQEQRRFILKNIRAGKIEVNSEIVLAESDGIIFFTRIDLIPISDFMINTILEWLDGAILTRI